MDGIKCQQNRKKSIGHWFGHIVRMKQNSLVKEIWESRGEEKAM